MGLFVDTSYWIALASDRDPDHAAALDCESKIAAHKTPLITTEAVLWEMLNSLSSPPLRSLSIGLYDAVHHDPQIRVIHCQQETRTDAITLYRDRADKSWGIVDCLSFVVMKEERLLDALTTDHHFEQAGFRAVLRENDGLPT